MTDQGFDIGEKTGRPAAPVVIPSIDQTILDADAPVERPPAAMELSGAVIRMGEWLVVVVIGIVLTIVMASVTPMGPIEPYGRVALLGGTFFALIAELAGCYDIDARFSLRVALARLLSAWLGSAVGMLTLAFFLKASEDFSRGWTILWFALGTGGLVMVRGAGVLWSRSLKSRGVFNQRVAILGTGAPADKLAEYILSNPRLTIDLVGCFDDRSSSRGMAATHVVPHLGDLDALVARVRAGGIDQVIIALPHATERRVREIVARLSMLPVLIRLAPDLSTFAFAGRSIVILGELPLMTLFERPINGMDRVIKRCEDMVIAGLAVALLAPLFAVIALLIRLDSKGPVFFRQRREGFNNGTFMIWKFRTMKTDMLQFDAIEQAKKRDPRVTRVGRILRSTSIDELPQLFNVLRGEMSLVGPRPHAPSTRVGDRVFSEAMENYAARHRVKPGMTGWAQVNGWRGETDTSDKLEKRVEHDLFYIENWSLRFDLYIILRTCAVVLFPRANVY
ncbi:Undecaprenyl-phosphate glucose phosphotransferase [Sphingomonas jinjuensis]|uniref:Undecaprenyl-phosphate glucose phosphotransferase n=1 Tax=Sphingomonas jinjuensis TaxID=535907 RepID=A0A840F8X6_9SPHN|nr:Undecaprenyl-phosphate glucose phosphotransferase [Sphingomonas jinjuensis]